MGTSSTSKGRSPNSPSLRREDAGFQAFLARIGRSLLAHRKRLGLSQQDVAEKIGIEPESVSRIENGVIAPTLGRLRQFAKVYSCSLEEIIGRSSDLPDDLSNRLGAELRDLPEVDRVFVTEHAIEIARHIKASRRRTVG